MANYTLKVIDLRRETADSVTVCFKQPALRKIKYQAGQYLSLIFRINGRRYIRPYSFSSAPGVDDLLEVTVKRITGGIISNHIFDRVQIGDLVEVLEPMGDFVIGESIIRDKPHVFLWGAGSGITPLFSIAKFLLNNTTLHMTLVYGNRNADSVIFEKQLKTLAEQFKDRFLVWHFHTRTTVRDDLPGVIQGRVEPAKVIAVLTGAIDLPGSLHYICGPVGLKESVRAGLSELSVPSSNIFSEDFELVKDEKELAEVITRSALFIQNGHVSVVEIVKGKSILEAGLDALIELPYSCQVGDCMLCKGRVLNGKLKYAGLKKTPAGLQEGEYLLCCAYPLSDDLKILIS